MKPILYIDMDGVVGDYMDPKHNKGGDDYKRVGFFKEMPEIVGMKDAVLQLDRKYDVYFLSTAPWSSPVAWKEKREWIEDKFGNRFDKKLILTHRKDLVIGDYLIDDRPTANGADKFKGKLLVFGSDKYPNWKSILKELM